MLFIKQYMSLKGAGYFFLKLSLFTSFLWQHVFFAFFGWKINRVCGIES